MSEKFTQPQRASFIKIVVSLRDDFRKRVQHYGYQSPLEDKRPLLQKRYKIAQLEQAEKRAQAAVDAAQAIRDKHRGALRDAERKVSDDFKEGQREYEADMERNFVRTMATIVAAADAAEAQAAIDRIL